LAAASATARSKVGALGFGLRLLRKQVCSTGSRKAAVLPLPVWLDTIRSMKTRRFIGITMGMANRNGLELHRGGLGKAQVFDRLNQLGARPSLTKPLGASGTSATGCSVSGHRRSVNGKSVVGKVSAGEKFALSLQKRQS
jgi:hypothetical protein